jgi:glycosyltransferase involved in cell wall biosynthesis
LTASSRSIHQFLVSTEYGGAAEIAIQLARQSQAMSGARAHVWAPAEGRASQCVRALGLPIHFYDGRGAFSRSRIRAGAANLATAARLRKFGRGLIHVHAPHTYAALRHGFRLAGVKRLLHIHLDFDLEMLGWALRFPPDLIVTCSRALVDKVREALPAHQRDCQRIEAVPNAVDVDKFKPAEKAVSKRRLGAPLDRPLVLMMANLAPHKGQETAIRAVAELRRRGTVVQLWLAGADRSPERSYESELRGLIGELGLDDRIELLGFRSDGPALLQAADLLLLPSTREGLPLTLLEAHATKVPVLAAPTAGIPEIVADAQTGYLIRAHDHLGYADRIARLLADNETYERITETAFRRCLTENSWDAYWRRISAIYKQLLSGNAVTSTGVRRRSDAALENSTRPDSKLHPHP